MPSGRAWRYGPFPKDLLGFPSATDEDLDRAKQVVLFAKSLIAEMPSAIVGYSVRVSYLRKLLTMDDCYIIPAQKLRGYTIFPSVLDGAGDEDPFVVCLAEESPIMVGSYVRVGVEFFLPMEEAGKSLKAAIELKSADAVGHSLRRVIGSIRAHTMDMDRKFDNNYVRIERARCDFWKRYQEIARRPDGVEKVAVPADARAIDIMMRCVSVVIRDTARNPDYLPQMCPFETDRSLVSTADGAFLAQCEEVLSLLKTATEEVLLPDMRSKLWEVCLDSPLAAFLRPILQVVAPAIQCSHRAYDEKFLAFPSLRESVFIFNTRNWRGLELDPFSHPFVFDSSDPGSGGYFPLSSKSEEKVSSADLEAIIGFDPDLLDLSQSAITGSTVAFALCPSRKPKGVLVADNPHRVKDPGSHNKYVVRVRKREVRPMHTIMADLEIRNVSCVWDISATAKTETRVVETRLTHGYDVDIAVFSKSEEEFDSIVDMHFQSIQTQFPHVYMLKVPRQKGHGWRIETKNYGEFIRLPPIEFFPSTIAAICSHHVAPVRACYTAAYQEKGRPARYLATASALRAYHTGCLDWFNYFASKKNFPQSILAKYIDRGYWFSCFVPEPIRVEVTQFLMRHPDWHLETPLDIMLNNWDLCGRQHSVAVDDSDEWKLP